MQTDDLEWAYEARRNIEEKYQHVIKKNKGRIPYTTDELGNFDNKADTNAYTSMDDGICWWTNGFWGGILWTLYEATKDSFYMKEAIETEKLLEESFRRFNGLHHDVGFMFIPTSVKNYKITKSEDAKQRALHAAGILAGRFNIAGNFIRAWNDIKDFDTRGVAIIDCMLNLSLLYWASEETNDPRYRHIAMAHADTVMKHFIKEDGHSIHIGEFNPVNGEFIKSLRGQGYDEASAWSRGQGWAVYGFLISYIKTNKKEYLDTAIKVADYIMTQMSEKSIVPVDFMQPKEPAWEDSCGACVIASAMLKLSEYDVKNASDYYSLAVRILRFLNDNRADYSKRTDAIITGCSAAYYNSRHDMQMNYADYFYMEAIYKLNKVGSFMW